MILHRVALAAILLVAPCAARLHGGLSAEEESAPGYSKNPIETELVSQVVEAEQRRLFVGEIFGQRAAEAMCGDDFNDGYGIAMNVASIGASIAGRLSPITSAGLYVIGASVAALQTSCGDSEESNLEEMKKQLKEYVDRKIKENNVQNQKAEIVDDIGYFNSLLEDYLEIVDGSWTEQQDKMDDINDYGHKLWTDLFEPETSMSNTIEAMGLTIDDWKKLTFEHAFLFSMLFNSIKIQDLANYNRLHISSTEMYATSGNGTNAKYTNLLKELDEGLSYFTRSGFRSDLYDWRLEQYIVSTSPEVVNRDCPGRINEYACRHRANCKCNVFYTIEDTMSDYIEGASKSAAYDGEVCFAENKNKPWPWQDNKGPGECTMHGYNKYISERKQELAEKWVTKVWQPDVWREFARNTEDQIDNIFGYQLRVGDTCITGNGRNKPVTASACVDDDPNQQWRLVNGTRSFRLVNPVTGADDLRLDAGEFLILTTAEASENTPTDIWGTGEWYFESADDAKGSVYIRNNGMPNQALRVADGTGDKVIVGVFEEQNWRYEWIWESPHLKLASAESLCLARHKHPLPIEYAKNFHGDIKTYGRLKLVSCENGEDMYEKEWDLQMNSDPQFHIMQRGTDLALSPNTGSLTLPSSFRLINPITREDDLRLDAGELILTTAKASENTPTDIAGTGEWYFESADDSKGSVYIRNNGMPNQAVRVADGTGNEVIVGGLEEQNWRYKWIWESPHLKLASADFLCLARRKHPLPIEDAKNFQGDIKTYGGLKLVSCENGEDMYEKEWDLEFSFSLTLEEFGMMLDQHWTMSRKGGFNSAYIQNVRSQQHISIGDDMKLNLGSVKDVFKKYPTMLDDEFADVLESRL